jgi:uncharacterized membrane protein
MHFHRFVVSITFQTQSACDIISVKGQFFMSAVHMVVGIMILILDVVICVVVVVVVVFVVAKLVAAQLLIGSSWHNNKPILAREATTRVAKKSINMWAPSGAFGIEPN